MTPVLSLGRQPGAGLRLGTELARGGEGVIHAIPGAPGSVAKLYAAPPTRERAAKVRAMVRLPPERRPAVAAWPTDVIEAGGALHGFVMPHLQARQELHAISNGPDRRRLFPRASYAMLVAVAANLARAMAAVHAAGHVVGDVNERCALLAADGTVALIDCDSYQFEADGVLHGCDVGSPNYQPPELQGVATFRGLRRTRNHDLFGLAVLIFQLLFFGRHPFAGRPVSGESPEITAAIRAHQFAWAGDRGLLQPPKSLALAAAGPEPEALFRRAFGPGGAGQGRPAAEEWARCLGRLQAALRRCPANVSHWHLGTACPLCALETQTGGELFATPTALRGTRQNPKEEADLAWAAIARVTPPPSQAPAPSLAVLRHGIAAVPYPPRPLRGWLGRVLQDVGMLGPPAHPERARRMARLRDASQRYERLQAEWRAAAAMQAFQAKQAELAGVRRELEGLFRQRGKAVAELQRSTVLHRHLDGFPMRQAGIKGVGKVRLETLEAHGITTAADATAAALTAIPGFGPKLKQAISEWRAGLARQCQAGAGDARLSPSAVKQADSRFAPGIAAGLAALNAGLQQLHVLAAQEQLAARSGFEALCAAARAMVQAEADLNAPEPR